MHVHMPQRCGSGNCCHFKVYLTTRLGAGTFTCYSGVTMATAVSLCELEPHGGQSSKVPCSDTPAMSHALWLRGVIKSAVPRELSSRA